eukprot:566841-Prorocentrum_minimum.AAC.1
MVLVVLHKVTSSRCGDLGERPVECRVHRRALGGLPGSPPLARTFVPEPEPEPEPSARALFQVGGFSRPEGRWAQRLACRPGVQEVRRPCQQKHTHPHAHTSIGNGWFPRSVSRSTS